MNSLESTRSPQTLASQTAAARPEDLRTRYVAFALALASGFVATALTCYVLGLRGAPGRPGMFLVQGVFGLADAIGPLPSIVATLLLLGSSAVALFTNAPIRSYAMRVIESLTAGFLVSVLMGTLGNADGGSLGLLLGERLGALMSVPIASTLCAVTTALAVWLLLEGNARQAIGRGLPFGPAPRAMKAPREKLAWSTLHDPLPRVAPAGAPAVASTGAPDAKLDVASTLTAPLTAPPTVPRVFEAPTVAVESTTEALYPDMERPGVAPVEIVTFSEKATPTGLNALPLTTESAGSTLLDDPPADPEVRLRPRKKPETLPTGDGPSGGGQDPEDWKDFPKSRGLRRTTTSSPEGSLPPEGSILAPEEQLQAAFDRSITCNPDPDLGLTRAGDAPALEPDRFPVDIPRSDTLDPQLEVSAHSSLQDLTDPVLRAPRRPETDENDAISELDEERTRADSGPFVNEPAGLDEPPDSWIAAESRRLGGDLDGDVEPSELVGLDARAELDAESRALAQTAAGEIVLDDLDEDLRRRSAGGGAVAEERESIGLDAVDRRKDEGAGRREEEGREAERRDGRSEVGRIAPDAEPQARVPEVVAFSVPDAFVGESWDLPRTIPAAETAEATVADAPMAETAAPAVVPLLDEGAPSLDEGASWLDEGAMDEHTAEAMIAGVVVSRAADAPPAPREAVQLLFDGVAPGETPLPELVKEYDRHESPAATLTSAVAPAVPETGAGRTRSGRRQRNKSNLVVNTTPVADAPPAPAIVQPTFDEILSKEGTDDATPAEPSNIDRAIRMVLGEGRASISFLQRKLEVSFGDAQHLMGELESQGIVGPYRGNPARDILLTLSEWEARRAQ